MLVNVVYFFFVSVKVVELYIYIVIYLSTPPSFKLFSISTLRQWHNLSKNHSKSLTFILQIICLKEDSQRYVLSHTCVFTKWYRLSFRFNLYNFLHFLQWLRACMRSKCKLQLANQVHNGWQLMRFLFFST